MNIQKIPINKLMPAEYNPRKELKPGDAEYEKLKRSLLEFGFVEPLVWNKTSGNVVGGHQRLNVLKDLGETEIDCVVVELDELKEKALNVALNRIQGSWDNDKLSALLSDLDSQSFDVTMTGFDASEVDELLNQFYSQEAIEDDFNVQKEIDKIKTSGTVAQQGEIWELGNHRLMCGDNSNIETYNKLLGNSKAELCVTAPTMPSQKEYLENGTNTWQDKINATVGAVSKISEVICWVFGDMYNTGSQFIEPTSVMIMNAFSNANLRPIWLRIWKKQNCKTNSKAYHMVTNKPIPEYEYVGAFGNEKAEYNDEEYEWISAFAAHSYKFVKRLTKEERKKWGYSGIWEMTSTKKIDGNASIMPIELPWRIIKMHSNKGGVVLDPYAQMGATIIACEQTDRCCYAIEKSEELCDCIIKRWENFTGLKAVKVC